MDYRHVPEFLIALRNNGPADPAKDALEWLILTATRTTETLGARLSEVSEKKATWTIPPTRASTKKTLVVPLSARALEIFAACKQRQSGKGDLLFEAAPGKPLSSMAMLVQMRRLKEQGVPHGFRYSFHSWAVDRAKKEQAAGKRDQLDNRRRLMDDWSAYCTSDRGQARPRRKS
jgi:integrase